ncbi:hypothetical protein HAZT_HAZT002713 [Hyalella azteca]|uniref:C2H2-type domain-containing protein n=1 Tax=Hyalella azteca TaxID=294128 RepID=A0A6A0H537_HYAAZ|nr:hypothetical protein HAZT_HAZT002713 [Hyalella azteca]
MFEAGPPPADAVAPTSASFFEDFAPSASHSLDLAAIGSVYQSLFALSGAALQQGATSASLHTPISSTSSPENKLKSLSSDGRAGLSGLIPFGIVDDVDERPFPCPFCESRFKKKQHLQNHERIHTGEKYLCSMCGQGFSRRHILKHHIYRKHLNNPRCGVTNSLSGPSDKNGSYSGSTPLSPPHFALLPMLQSNSNRSLKTNNFHPTSGNSQSNGDDAAATGSDLLPHAGGTATDVDSALMDELPDTVASLLSSATVATGGRFQYTPSYFSRHGVSSKDGSSSSGATANQHSTVGNTATFGRMTDVSAFPRVFSFSDDINAGIDSSDGKDDSGYDVVVFTPLVLTAVTFVTNVSSTRATYVITSACTLVRGRTNVPRARGPLCNVSTFVSTNYEPRARLVRVPCVPVLYLERFFGLDRVFDGCHHCYAEGNASYLFSIVETTRDRNRKLRRSNTSGAKVWVSSVR